MIRRNDSLCNGSDLARENGFLPPYALGDLRHCGYSPLLIQSKSGGAHDRNVETFIIGHLKDSIRGQSNVRHERQLISAK